ncbi:tail length tape measure protein [Gordonia phage EMoore]|uniref:Tape measure protein n=1 Tax=Gordonia phage EMoore TaxID=2656534 RepID=A0A649VUZ2_9CAUD|nr:tail length tape measure protein [Gordonia phage EMoore]QGJ95815.1 tape measure protein [Gordonia phage EMoore]
MTAGGGEWAESSVDVTLNWDNVEGELRDRLERASAQAARQVRKNFAKLEVALRQQFDRMATGFAKSMQKIDSSASRTATSVQRSWAVALTRMMSATEAATTRIKQSLDEIPRNIAVRIAVSHTGMEPTDIRRLTTALTRLQQVGNVDALVSVQMAGANAADITAMASALRRLNRVGDNVNLVINVTVNGMAEVERLNLLLRSLPRRTSTRVDVDANSAVRAAKTIGGLGGSVLGVMGTFAKWTSIAGAATVALGGMMPVVAALGAALASAAVAGAGAFAAGMGAMLVAVAALKTAFSGVGDALKSAFDPADAEKFNEALAKLSPEAQKSVLAVQSLGKEFKSVVGLKVQDAMFAGLAPQIEQLQKLLGPVRDAMLTVVDGFNEGAKSALRFVNSARGATVVKTLLGESANMAGNFGSALGNLVPGILAIGAGSAQVFGPMTNGIAGAARSLSEFLVRAQESGQMQAFFERAVEVARQLGAVLGELGGIIGGVFRAASAAGDGQFLGSLMTSLESINAWVNGPGAGALQQFFASTAQAMGVVMPILLQVAGIIGGQVAPALAGLITAIGPAVSDLVANIGQGIAALAPAMGPLGTAISAIATALGPVMPVLGQLIATFVQLAGPIIGALAQALGPVLVTVGNSLITILQALMPAVQPIADLFVALGPVIGQLASMLGGMLGAALQVLVPVVVLLANGLTAVLPIVTGLLQMLQPLTTAIGALAAGVLVAYGAFKVFKLVQTIISGVRIAWMLLNLAWIASPIGVIITGITALIAGLALFFTKTEVGRNLWDKIWGSIKSTWDVVWGALQSGFQKLGDIAKWLWENALKPAFDGIGKAIGFVKQHWEVFAAVLGGPIGILAALQSKFGVVTTVINALGTAISWLWQNVIQPAFSVIGAIIGAAWSVIKVVFDLWLQGVKAVGAVVLWLWNNVVTPAFNVIGAVIGAAWSVIKLVFDGWKMAIQFVGNIVMWLWNNVVAPAFSAIGTIISTAWGVISNVFEFLGQGIKNIGAFFGDLAVTMRDKATQAKDWVVEKFTAVIDFFRGLPDKVRQFASAIWEPIQSAAKTVFNTIANLWNNTVGRLSFTIPDIPGMPGRGQTISMPQIPTFAHGGSVRGPGTGTSDSILARLSNGEFVEPAAAVTPATLPLLEAIRGGWQPPVGLFEAMVPGFAPGGLVGREPYGLPVGTSGEVNVPWVDEIEKRFGVKASTYAGHQEKSGKNKGIDWSGPVPAMQRLAEYFRSIKGDLEQVIWMNPETGERIGVADGQMVGPGTSQPGYYANDWADHTDHVHTRQSYSLGGSVPNARGIDNTPGGASPTLGGTAGAASSTPIGSGIASSSSGGSSSWGNSGGGSKYNSAEEASKANVVPVWVENWPATMGGGGGGLGGAPMGPAAGLGGAPAPAAAGGGAAAVPAGAGIGKLTRSSSKQEVGEAIYWEARKRGYSHEDAIKLISTGLQESGLSPTAIGGGGAWHGVYQQDTSYPGRDDPNKNIEAFLDRMDKKRKGPGASQDMWKNIFWLQQAPGIDTAEGAYSGGRQAYLTEIQSQQAEAKRIADAAAAKAPKPAAPAPSSTTTTTTSTTTATPPPDLGGVPPTTPPPPAATPGATPGATPTGSQSMPFGQARADAWAREQDFGKQARNWALGAVTEEVGGLLAPIGADGLFKQAIDELIKYLDAQPQQAPQTVKYADTVNNYGTSGKENRDKMLEGMTAVTETYRQG